MGEVGLQLPSLAPPYSWLGYSVEKQIDEEKYLPWYCLPSSAGALCNVDTSTIASPFSPEN